MVDFDLGHFIKHKFKDTLNNLKMALKSEYRFKMFNGREVLASPGGEYKTVFEDNFQYVLDKDKWEYAQPWGNYHPDYLHQYYDIDGIVCYTSDKGLVLGLKNLPQTFFNEASQHPITIPTVVGMVHSKDSWKYGWFEAMIKLPEGQSYWPAFWLTGKNSWPPEIDIFEAYSHIGPKYDKPNFFKWFKRPNQKIQPNLHYGNVRDGSKQMYGPRDIPIPKVTERFVQYACLWEKNKIEIYYDGAMVFKCTDSKILEWYNKYNTQQYIVINHGLHSSFPSNPTESDMLVRSVKVMQK